MADQPDRRGGRVAPAAHVNPANQIASGGATAEPGEVADAALDRFGTDRLGGGPETDRLLAVDHRPRTPEVRLQAGLRADAGRLLANWVVRIANLPVYRARPDLALDQLMDGLPAVVHAVLHAAATPDPGLDPDPAARAAEAAAEHARRRAAAGFPVDAVLAEFRELHLELLTQLWRIATETAPPTKVDAEPAAAVDFAWVPRMMIERLAATVGDLSVATVETFGAMPPGEAAGEPTAADQPEPKGQRR
jgi:hypothetical protein